jgi:hypothetical protein
MAENVCLNRSCAKSSEFWTLLVMGGLVALGSISAFFYLEHHGHIMTGMNNQVVWGLPHVFAVFLIVAASGVLNVASIGSVFGKKMYKARAPLSGMLALAMLAGPLQCDCSALPSELQAHFCGRTKGDIILGWGSCQWCEKRNVKGEK